tara:strand:+ start:421 stop:1098 length:678 start_codon:yes stop_codon:yes gene_type:complete
MSLWRSVNVKTPGHIVCTILLLLLGQTVDASAFSKTGNKTIQPGMFLIADPVLDDPYFRQTVVLLWSHGEHGTHGVVINRPLNTPLSQALPKVTELTGVNMTLYFGGPVAPEQPIILFRHPNEMKKAQRVFSNVHVSANLDVLQSLRESYTLEEVLRVYSGHAGWGPGQLASEMEQGAWHVLQGDAHFIFNSDPRDVWSKLFEVSKSIQVYRQPSALYLAAAYQF